ncbi:hypothetical protein B0H11DRAFT_2307414 [Mycena galericulata]|nr:hypothetical protein B0H11DRAFT_2307414 [Mycena galericulata]
MARIQSFGSPSLGLTQTMLSLDFMMLIRKYAESLIVQANERGSMVDDSIPLGSSFLESSSSLRDLDNASITAVHAGSDTESFTVAEEVYQLIATPFPIAIPIAKMIRDGRFLPPGIYRRRRERVSEFEMLLVLLPPLATLPVLDAALPVLGAALLVLDATLTPDAALIPSSMSCSSTQRSRLL